MDTVKKLLQVAEEYAGIIIYWVALRVFQRSPRFPGTDCRRHLILLDGYLVAGKTKETLEADPYFGELEHYCNQLFTSVHPSKTLVHFLYTPTPVRPLFVFRAIVEMKRQQRISTCHVSNIFQFVPLRAMLTILLPGLGDRSLNQMRRPSDCASSIGSCSETKNWSRLEKIKFIALCQLFNQTQPLSVSVFSWYENQGLQRTFFQSVRSFRNIPSSITGCAFYIPYGGLEALMPSEQDQKSSAAPDRVAYLCKSPVRVSGIDYIKGVATRQTRIFSAPLYSASRSYQTYAKTISKLENNTSPTSPLLLLALPWDIEIAKILIQLARKLHQTMADSNSPPLVQLHPNNPTQQRMSLPKEFQVTENIMSARLPFSSILLTSATSIGFDAAFFGVSSIYLDNEKGCDSSPFFPEDNGTLYRRVRDLVSARNAIRNFTEQYRHDDFRKDYFARLQALKKILPKPGPRDYHNFLLSSLTPPAQRFLSSPDFDRQE